MNYLRFAFLTYLTLYILIPASNSLYASSPDKFVTIGIMQDKKGSASSFAPLIKYFKTKGLDIKLLGFHSYRDAANKFKNGKIDAMFAGSGVAAIMILKDLASPLVRPLHNGGWSTYRAVVIIPKSNNDFKLTPEYFADKKIICCALASSGEFFCNALLGKSKKLLIAGNHGNAISALSKGAADIAIVKNRVWDQVKKSYPNLKKITQDTGENPDWTLIVSKNLPAKIKEKLKNILLNLDSDSSPEAYSVRNSLKIKGYIPTNIEDFKHTLQLLKKAGINKDFNF
jgi:ABC-type phosphate/phosphonate transport system substrate-binding protein